MMEKTKAAIVQPAIVRNLSIKMRHMIVDKFIKVRRQRLSHTLCAHIRPQLKAPAGPRPLDDTADQEHHSDNEMDCTNHNPNSPAVTGDNATEDLIPAVQPDAPQQETVPADRTLEPADRTPEPANCTLEPADQPHQPVAPEALPSPARALPSPVKQHATPTKETPMMLKEFSPLSIRYHYYNNNNTQRHCVR